MEKWYTGYEVWESLRISKNLGKSYTKSKNINQPVLKTLMYLLKEFGVLGISFTHFGNQNSVVYGLQI